MKGKFVNLLMGLLNIMVGAMILLYTLKVPSDITSITVQEATVLVGVKIAIYVLIGFVSFINILGFYNNKINEGLRFGYKLFLFTISFVFIKIPFIAIIPIISGFIIINRILHENLREIESTFAISIIIVLIILTLITDCLIYFYGYMGSYILKKKNENQTEYSSSFFRYITELDGEDIYINVKKDGKYGYVDTAGNVKIDFKYDYASPFTTIEAYDKQFQVALVCEDGISKIIMKNERVVKSYVSESADENYAAKLEELNDFYKNTIKMEDEMQFEVFKFDTTKNRIPVYLEDSEEYTYRYDYNDEYDIIVIQSSMGLKDIYTLAKKDDLDYQIELNCDNLDYDENYLYIFKDGTIPYYNTDTDEQGWFSPRGVKKPLKGNAQILEKIGDTILYRDYSRGGIIKFVNQDGTSISDSYKEIYVQNDGERYIVKKQNDKYVLLDSEYNQITEEEYDYCDTSLTDVGVYLFGNINNDVIKFNDFNYADLNFVMIDNDGNKLIENLQQVYSKFYSLEDDGKLYVKRYNDFITNLEIMDSQFVGDKFYKK